VVIGFSTSGPRQAETIRAALAIRVGGRPLFRSVQATWNLLEPSAGPALAEAHEAGCLVIVKEALANGRLAVEGPGDAVALAAALRQPWATIVLSGAATADQLASNLRAETMNLRPETMNLRAETMNLRPETTNLRAETTNLRAETISARFDRDLAMPADRYWQERSRLPWG
jgi:aryl-alcohol dehydrogenase-like predicted oxidoreductase